MMEKPIEVVIADDHGIVTESLRLYLENAGLNVVGTAASGRQAVEQVKKTRPDVLLLDIRMPDMDGIEALAKIKREVPETTVIMLTSVDEYASMAQAIALGAAGYLLKDTTPKQIPNIIRAVMEGDAIIDQNLLREALTTVGFHAQQAQQNAEPPIKDLTEQEQRVLLLLAQGLDNDTIARTLVVSRNTIKTHITSIFRKLNVSNRTQAAIWAFRNGIIH